MNNDAQRMLERARLRKVEFENHIKTLDEDLESEAQQLFTEKETDLATWTLTNENDKENSDSLSPSKYGLRNAVKLKLDKLGKLYAGEEVSSPIHRSNVNDSVSPKSRGLPAGKLSQARSARLAALANTINNWEDDLSNSKKPSPTKVVPGKLKVLGNRNVQEIISSNKSNEIKSPIKESKKVVIEDSIAKTLEAQGFQRCESQQHLVYDYKSPSNSPGKCLNKINYRSPIKSPDKNTPKICGNKELPLKDTSHIANTSHRFLPPGKSSQSCEVLKMAAKYEVATSPKKTVVKDPAELSLADRKALFERGDNGTAILPKAPFAMAVPSKLLRSDDNKTNTPLAKTPNCKRTPGTVRTPHLASTLRQTPLSETPERPTVGDNVTREILERRREIEELRNRWDKKRKEVVDKFPDEAVSRQDIPTSPAKTIPVPPPLPTGENHFSPSTFKNKYRTDELMSPGSPPKKERKSSISPVVKTALEGIKPIRLSPPKGLYPSVADIETDSDLVEDDRQSDLETISEAGEDRMLDNSESTSEAQDASIESEDSAQSFGKHIVASSRENSRSNLKRPAFNRSSSKTYIPSKYLNSSDSSFTETPYESTEESQTDKSTEGSQQNITADEARVLHEIDDFLDEALGEPTPPKKIKEENKREEETTKTYRQTDKQYSKPYIVSAELKVPSAKHFVEQEQRTPTSDEINRNIEAKEKDGPNTPLVYTISLYRKQQTSLIKTPVKREVHTDISEMVVDSPEESFCEEELVKQRMEELQIEIKRQVAIISQASQALNLCMSSIEFSGSTEELEAEKLLLLATSRRIAATHELERLTVEQKLHPGGHSDLQEDGTLTIESLSVKAKRIPSALDETIHLLCLVKSGCTVQATEILPLTRQALTDNNRLVFRKSVQIEHARHNLQTTVEVYALTNKSFMHHLRGECSKEKLKMTPKKGGKKENKRYFIVESPAGPNAIRSPSFQLIGFVVFTLKDITRNHFTLNKVPGNAPIEGFLEMKVKGQVNLDNLRHEGFLTLFQEIGGFGAWKRAWCILKGHLLSFCNYPDPMRAMASCFETIDLSECITREVGLAPKDVCVRTDTVMLECKRVGMETEVVRYLLSADSLQERLEWCHYINKVLNLLRLWNPVNRT